MRFLRRLRGAPVPGALAMTAALLAGVVVIVGARSDGARRTALSGRKALRGHVPAAVGPGPRTPRRTPLARALRSGLRQARRLGGRAEAAIWVQGWARPIVASTDGRQKASRMWSMSKAVTAVAVYELRSHPSRTLANAMARALRRSENCRERRVVLGLQQLASGSRGARKRFLSVLDQAGVAGSDVFVPSRPARLHDDLACLPYLASAWPQDPQAPALQLGTATWFTRDAVRFALALARGAYGRAGEKVLALMRLPKAPSRDADVVAGAYSVSSQSWGAGNAFRRWRPAYKSGWGGSNQNRFIVGQIVAMRVRGVPVGVTAMFHPSSPTASDDPGRTVGPRALEAIFDEIAASLPDAFPAR